MNLVLLYPSDFLASGRVCLTGRRLQHIQEILQPAVGDSLVVGLLDDKKGQVLSEESACPFSSGQIGRGRIMSLTDDAVELEVVLDIPPPAKLPVVLCVALMRPPVLRRLLQTAAAMGVPAVHIFHCARVEKSFWQSTVLRDGDIRHELELGLEQARDTVLPEVVLHKRFRPFAEDILPGLAGRDALVADPSGEQLEAVLRGIKPGGGSGPRVLVIGPEGGFVPFELEKFREAGCRVASLGERILRVETAVVALLARLYL
ncbi:MAG: 16S rRNA (uracil(1498)-N(3))-methyltransferase [Candidatus Omnitrophica bacterium]|nr:16S rRNA (uracil(1498)-N(3))-methyltransferase [Candidatus Omnitrophota bacterium]